MSAIAFSARAHWNYPAHWLELWRSQLAFTPACFEENESWVAELSGQPPGTAWLEDLWVHPDGMRKGLGRRLFPDALERARARGSHRLRLESDPHALGFTSAWVCSRSGNARMS